MLDPPDFAELLSRYMERSGTSPGNLSRLTGQVGAPKRVPKQTIVNWLKGNVTTPRNWSALVWVARALRLNETETDALLQSAGHPPVRELAEQNKDPKLGEFMRDWDAYLHAGRDYDPLRPLHEIERAEAENLHKGIQVIRKVEAAGFVGRGDELDYYAARLAKNHLAVITGMAGVGKSSLAAMLAKRVASPKNVFWHAFQEEESAEKILWELAYFLAWHGKDDLRRLMYTPQQMGSSSPPPEVLREYLFRMLRSQGYLICLDDFHLVEKDPHVTGLVNGLLELVSAGDLSMIVASRNLPDFVKASEYEALIGLGSSDTRQLLSLRNVDLADDLVGRLHKTTEGNPQLLGLAIDVLQQADDPVSLVANLEKAKDIGQYLLKQVDEKLSESERQVMGAVAVLRAYPGTRDAIEAILDRGSLLQDIQRLTYRHLLAVSDGPQGREYSQHALVQAYYYDALGRARKKMHRQAAQYYEYEIEAPDFFIAARHYEKAADTTTAARLATRDIWSTINRGQVRGLQRLLEQLQVKSLEAKLSAELSLSLGVANALLGEETAARQSFQDALAKLDSLPDMEDVRILRARACHDLAGSLEYSQPREAFEWIQRGLEQAIGISAYQEAALRIKAGSIHIAMGSFDEAAEQIQHGLEILHQEADWLRAGAIMNLATIHGIKGDLSEAGQFTQQAGEIYQRLGDQFRLVDVWTSLGLVKDYSGDWAGAVTEYQKALETAERLGSITQQARLNLNLGVLNTNRGDDEAALANLTTALDLARQAGLIELEIDILGSTTELFIRQRNLAEARQFNSQAEGLIEARGVQTKLPELYRHWAEVELLEDSLELALEHVNKSLGFTRQFEMDLEAGLSLRVLGQVYQVLGQSNSAGTAFQESFQILEDNDPFEAARTLLALGIFLLDTGDLEQGNARLLESRDALLDLGADRELKIIESMLSQSEG